MIDRLDETNFLLYAAKHYDNPQCYDTIEFYDDLKRFKYIKRLLNRYHEEGDLKERLIRLMPDCQFLDTPNWDCPNPDFLFLGKYRYAFVSFVVKKKS